MPDRTSDADLAALQARLHDPAHPLAGWDAFAALVDELVELRAITRGCDRCGALRSGTRK